MTAEEILREFEEEGRNILKNTVTMVKEVDKTITSVCERIQKGALLPEEYATAVSALASLVEARVKMI